MFDLRKFSWGAAVTRSIAKLKQSQNLNVRILLWWLPTANDISWLKANTVCVLTNFYLKILLEFYRYFYYIELWYYFISDNGKFVHRGCFDENDELIQTNCIAESNSTRCYTCENGENASAACNDQVMNFWILHLKFDVIENKLNACVFSRFSTVNNAPQWGRVKHIFINGLNITIVVLVAYGHLLYLSP